MKEVLIATDFSKASVAAANYMMKLLKSTGQLVKVTLINTYLVTSTFGDDLINLNDSLKEESLEMLKVEKKRILNYTDQLGFKPQVDTISRMGSLESILSHFLKEKDFDMLVMGKGDTSKVQTVLKTIKDECIGCPVLLFNEFYQYRGE